MNTSVGVQRTLPSSTMIDNLASNWWLMLLRAIAAIVFGVLAFVWPGITLLSLVLVYGIYAIADGIFALLAAWRGEGGAQSRWWLIIVGLLGLAAGLLTFIWPPITAIALILFIGVWSLVHGVFEIVGAIRLRKEIDNEWMLILSGIVSVLFGLVAIFMPGTFALAFTWVIGAYAILFGILFAAFAFRLRKHHAKQA